MCGIIAVLRRVSRRQPPKPEQLLSLLTEAEGYLLGAPTTEHLDNATNALSQLNSELRGVPAFGLCLKMTNCTQISTLAAQLCTNN